MNYRETEREDRRTRSETDDEQLEQHHETQEQQREKHREHSHNMGRHMIEKRSRLSKIIILLKLYLKNRKGIEILHANFFISN